MVVVYGGSGVQVRVMDDGMMVVEVLKSLLCREEVERLLIERGFNKEEGVVSCIFRRGVRDVRNVVDEAVNLALEIVNVIRSMKEMARIIQ